jgi:hypothetical protein
MTLPPFSLPSEPAKKITLREATVEDCMDFAGVSRSHEEAITTLFLNRLQDKASFVDAKTWTAEDRRFGVFWYWIHTAKDPEVPTTYECGHCGKSHTYLADYRQMTTGYQPMKGLPEREITNEEEKLTVHPLNGADVEALEMAWLELELISKNHGKNSGEYGKRATALKVERLCRSLGWTSASDEIRIKAMGMAQYNELSEKVEFALEDMTHGLDSLVADGAIGLWLLPHQCPNVTDKEVSTRVWVNFRCLNYMPKI